MIIRADARALPLREACVDCVVTSPPYWNLRDYGTARWDGGDESCTHSKNRAGGISSSTLDGGKATTNHQQEASYRDRCGLCGAVRVDPQLGLEPTPDAYVAALVGVFREVARVLKDSGTVWLNLGDSYAGGGGYAPNAPCNQRRAAGESWGAMNRFAVAQGEARAKANPGYVPAGLKPKDLVGIPWRVAFALQADGWYLRSDIIWHKPNPMPESVTDRPTKAHEYVFLLTRSARYFYDAAAIMETAIPESEQRYRTAFSQFSGGSVVTGQQTRGSQAATVTWTGQRNKRTVWTLPTMPYAGAHFATMPEALVEPCILAGCPLGGLVLDPFLGSGTVGAVAERLGRRWVGTDLSYQPLSKERTAQRGIRFDEPEEVA